MIFVRNRLLILFTAIVLIGCNCTHSFFPIGISRSELRKNHGEIKAKYFFFDCYSPFYVDDNELQVSINLGNADSLKHIKIIRITPYVLLEKDSLINLGYKGGVNVFKSKKSIKKTNRLNLTLQYSVIENRKVDTITERFTLKKKRSCQFAVH